MVSEIGIGQAARFEASPVAKEAGQVEPVSMVAEQAEMTGKNEQRLPIQKADSLVDGMNTFLASANAQLKFVMHDELKEYYVTIVDTKTDEVIREIPSKKLMDIHAAMKEFVGLLVDRKI